MSDQRRGLELRIVRGPGAGSRVALRPGENLVGRGTSRVQVRLESRVVSRRHLVIYLDGADVVARDLASRNGTYVNGARLIGTRELQDGDTIEVGEVTLQLVRPAEGEAAAPPATGSTPLVHTATVSVGSALTGGEPTQPVREGSHDRPVAGGAEDEVDTQVHADLRSDLRAYEESVGPAVSPPTMALTIPPSDHAGGTGRRGLFAALRRRR